MTERVPLKGLTNVDGWTNVLTGLGVQNRDKRLSAQVTRANISSMDFLTLEELFHNDDMAARVTELPAKEMTREWVEFSDDEDGRIESRVNELNARGKACEVITWARLYGGSVILMGANDGQDYSKPLNLDRVRSVDFLTVIDRFDLNIVKLYQDPRQPNFGQPEFYRVTSLATNVGVGPLMPLIHESRILRFDGTLTGRRRRLANQGWSLSIMERVHDVIRDFVVGHNAIALLLQDYSQAVFKIKGLAGMLASDQDALVLKRLQLLDVARSICRAIPLDAEGEDFKREATPVTGLADLIDRIGVRLSSATGMPITLLLGEAPGGLQATGDSDHRNWYNVVSNEQETQLRPQLARLFLVIARSLGIKPKDNAVPFEFRPLWQATEKEIVESRKTQAETDKIYYDMGALDTSEIVVSRFGGPKYSHETTIDKRQLDQNLPAPDPSLDPSQDPNATPDIPGANGAAAVQDTALNGAQVTALNAMLASVATKALDPEAAQIAILLSFPSFDETKVKAMVNAITIKEPPAPVITISSGAPKNAPGNSPSPQATGNVAPGATDGTKP